MRSFRFNLLRSGAIFALALMILTGVVPAFAQAGTWFCRNNQVCPIMNGVKASQPVESEPTLAENHCRMAPQPDATAHACCAKSKKVSLEEAMECRFVVRDATPAPMTAIQKDAAQRDQHIFVVLPASLDRALDALRAAPADFPLPHPVELPPPPPLRNTGLRAPPLG